MKVILIGAGRLATNLGKALLEAGHDILQVYSRTMESASALATLAGGAPVTEIEKVRKDADVYIISVKDSVVPDLVQALCSGRSTKVFLHTAGSVNMDVFAGMALHYGVFYPMQSFSKEKTVSFHDIPFLWYGYQRSHSQYRDIYLRLRCFLCRQEPVINVMQKSRSRNAQVRQDSTRSDDDTGAPS